jgi:hypothetical protein
MRRYGSPPQRRGQPSTGAGGPRGNETDRAKAQPTDPSLVRNELRASRLSVQRFTLGRSVETRPPSPAPPIPSPDWSCRADRDAGSPIVSPTMPVSCTANLVTGSSCSRLVRGETGPRFVLPRSRRRPPDRKPRAGQALSSKGMVDLIDLRQRSRLMARVPRPTSITG